MSSSKDALKYSRIKRATKECACTLLENFLEHRLGKLSEAELGKLHQLANYWFAEKTLHIEAMRHIAEPADGSENSPYAPQVTPIGVTRALSDISREAIPLIDQLLNDALPAAHCGTEQSSRLGITFVDSIAAKLPIAQAGKALTAEAFYIDSLSPREIEILKLLGRGLSMKGAARGLEISPGTVKWHVKNLYEKLGATSREDALSKARLRQLIH